MSKSVQSSIEYYRKFEIILHSATDLHDVREHGKMKVYAKISISGVPESEFETPVDKERETSPCWNCKVKYMLGEETVHQESTIVVIKLYCKRLLGDKYVGEVNINLKSLFDNSRSRENLIYDVLREDSGGTFGKINLSYNFGETVIFDELISEKPSRFRKIIKGGVIMVVQVVLGAVVA